MSTYSFLLAGLAPAADELRVAFLLGSDDRRMCILESLSQLDGAVIRQKGHISDCLTKGECEMS